MTDKKLRLKQYQGRIYIPVEQTEEVAKAISDLEAYGLLEDLYWVFRDRENDAFDDQAYIDVLIERVESYLFHGGDPAKRAEFLKWREEKDREAAADRITDVSPAGSSEPAR